MKYKGKLHCAPPGVIGSRFCQVLVAIYEILVNLYHYLTCFLKFVFLDGRGNRNARTFWFVTLNICSYSLCDGALFYRRVSVSNHTFLTNCVSFHLSCDNQPPSNLHSSGNENLNTATFNIKHWARMLDSLMELWRKRSDALLLKQTPITQTRFVLVLKQTKSDLVFHHQN